MKNEASLTAPAAGTHVSRGGEESLFRQTLAREHRLGLYVDGAPFAQLVCTPSQLRELVLGRLCTAGRIAVQEDVLSLTFSDAEDRADICICPGAVRASAQPPTDRSAWRREDIFLLAGCLPSSMPLHDATMGTHGCLLLHRGEILCCCEDIGRHNAIDKAVGTALTRGIPLNECVLYTTGRIAVDIVEKTVTAGVPVLVSRTLPTAEAVALAETRGLTLIGRAWEAQYEVFTRPCCAKHDRA